MKQNCPWTFQIHEPANSIWDLCLFELDIFHLKQKESLVNADDLLTKKELEIETWSPKSC